MNPKIELHHCQIHNFCQIHVTNLQLQQCKQLTVLIDNMKKNVIPSLLQKKEIQYFTLFKSSPQMTSNCATKYRFGEEMP